MGCRRTDCASAADEGALHEKTLKSLRSRAPKAVGLHARVGRDADIARRRLYVQDSIEYNLTESQK